MSTATRAPATPKGEATRAYLLRTAARVFAERGYVAATQAELIAAAGLTKGAFYFHFSSKADLALAVLQDQKSRWLAQISEAISAEPTAAGQLRALLPAMLRLVAEDPSAWSVTRLSHELAADPQLGPQVGQATREWITFLAGIVRRGQAEGSLRDGLDPEAVATVLIGAFDGLKSLVDVLAPADGATGLFPERARTLLALLEAPLFQPG
jgi:TetR/AcrR family transcriptional repressor of nem operon